MTKELKPLDITNSPELLRLAEEIKASQEPRVLVTEAEELVEVRPVPSKRRRRLKGRPVTEADPLFKSIGSARSGIPGGASSRKHEFLARAYRPR